MNRLKELDVFRGLAALAVVIYHYTSYYETVIGHTSPMIFNFRYGTYGVQWFFMISGYVIFMTLNNTRRPMDFVVSRFSRLYPAYWMGVFLTYFAVAIFGLEIVELSGTEVLINLSMLQNFFGVENLDGSYWTLLYEMIFYFIMFGLYSLRLLNRIEMCCLLWLMLQSAWLFAEAQGWYIPWKIQTLFILKYCHLFIAGIIFFQLSHTKPRAVHYQILFICLATQALSANLVVFWVVSCFFVAFFLFIHNKLSFIIVRPLLFLGTISYSLYLIHQNIGYIVIRELEELTVTPYLAIFAAMTISILIAYLMNVWVEKPSMKAVRGIYNRRFKNTD